MNIFRSLLLTILLALAWNVQGTTLKIATLSPEGAAWVVELRKAAKEIASQTEDRVKLKLYSGGVMGDDAAVLRKIRARQLSGAIVQTGALNAIASNVQLYNMPLFFRNIEEVMHVRDRMDQKLKAELIRKNFISFGFSGVGLAYAMGTSPARNVAEARRLKVWAPKGDPAANSLLQAFGITPIPLTFIDVLAGLQTGLIDTVTSPPVAAIALQWHTSVKYILDVPFLYVYGVFLVDKRQFDRISDEDQKIVARILEDAVAAAEVTGVEDHNVTWDVLLSQGIEPIEPNAQELAEWRRLAQNAADDWLKRGIIAPEYFNEMKQIVDEYRNSIAVENP